MNKRKIINDPVYGLINFHSQILYEIIEHPFFQRLRRIKQLGLTDYVYPGATHTRFEHVLGATFLMQNALDELRSKGVSINEQEYEGTLIAILLHDMGHGPFSHTLEHELVHGIRHEDISSAFMQALNLHFDDKLRIGIEIFTGKYPRKIFHKLVSGQLDMDRLDYLMRDSFYTGVSEGVVGSERIIKMLNEYNDDIAVDEKGIYSVEKFLIARRLMYWQVYLHKTVVSAEQMLVRTLRRARHCFEKNDTETNKSIAFFFKNKIQSVDEMNSMIRGISPLEMFSNLDDSDIIQALKTWSNNSDKVLSFLASSIINRRIFKIEISNNPFEKEKVEKIQGQTCRKFDISLDDVRYLVINEIIANKAYNPTLNDRINIKKKNGRVVEIAEASDISNISALAQKVEKYILCYPKEILI